MPGLEEPDKIDVIAEGTDGGALLSIVQTGQWRQGNDARNRLKRKLSTYLRYATEGQMVETYPVLKDKPVTIELTYEHPPPQFLLEYWERRARDVKGVTMTHRTLDDVVWRA